MLLTNVEYVSLRLLRRFVIRGRVLEALSVLVPYYRTNQGEVSPEPVVEEYETRLRSCGCPLRGRTIAELGSGRTNSTGYALAARGAARVFSVEPFATFDVFRDALLMHDIASRYRVTASFLSDRVYRVDSLAELESGSVDLIVSNSVLEHVRDVDGVLTQACRCLAPDGRMLHLVDYRDHFFKYPYHFLQFDRRTWERWFDPGDLPRWRLGDHLRAFQRHGFKVRILERQEDTVAFSRVRDNLSSEFDASDADTRATFAALLCIR